MRGTLVASHSEHEQPVADGAAGVVFFFGGRERRRSGRLGPMPQARSSVEDQKPVGRLLPSTDQHVDRVAHGRGRVSGEDDRQNCKTSVAVQQPSQISVRT